MTTGHYLRSIGDLKRRLADAVPRELLRELHRREPRRHFAVVLRQALLFAAAFAAGWVVESPWVRLPAAVVLGFWVFDGTVLLHEVVHRAVFERDRPTTYRLLGLLYALPSGLSPSQFTRWHLDHHAELGSPTEDPKRAHLSPKRNSRLLKLLYATPALFPIYFRAARTAAASYPEDLRRRIAFERLAATALHLAVAAGIALLGGWERLLWLWAVPVFLVFPPVFTLNRLGQHYDVVPGEPAKWGTRMAPSRVWDFAWLWSSYHLEHHYFPTVPFYRLRELNAALTPFFAREGIRERRYRDLLRDWLVRNRPPHADWSLPERPPGGPDASGRASADGV